MQPAIHALCVASIIIFTFMTQPAVGAGVSGFTEIYHSSWEDGMDSKIQIQSPNNKAIEMVGIPRLGGTMLRTTMHRTDDFSHIANGAPRSELSFVRLFNFIPENEYEIRWSTLIPSVYPLDSLQSEIITQIHQSDSNIGSPPFSLMISGQHYQVDVRGDVNRSPAHSFFFGSPLLDEGHIVHWVLQYRPSDNGTNAVTDLYQNGMLVVHADAIPNAYPNDKHAYLKIGIYKWWWKTRPSDVIERTMYYGNVEVRARSVVKYPMN